MTFNVLQLQQKYQALLLFDCPTSSDQPLSNLSQEILNIKRNILYIFSETSIPDSMKFESKETSQNLNDENANRYNNIHSIYDLKQVWLILGMFSAMPHRQVHIFTDNQEEFKTKFSLVNPENTQHKCRIFVHDYSEASSFNIEQVINPWNNFENHEALSQFEIQQVRAILKKFMKQVVTSKPPSNLEKLVHISNNLVNAHLSTLAKERYKVQSDLTFHFIRSLFLDKVFDNQIIFNAIMNNEIRNLSDFETFTKIKYSQKFEEVIEQIRQQIQKKQKELQEQQMNQEQSQQMIVQNIPEEEKQNKQEYEGKVVRQAIQDLISQYLNLFHKSKIFEIKKLAKLAKQIANYVNGYIMKKATSENNQEKELGHILNKNQDVICANILREVAKLEIIKKVDQNIIEHDHDAVKELIGKHSLKQIDLKDLVFNQEFAKQILESPMLIFKSNDKNEKLIDKGDQDVYDLYLDKLLNQMKISGHFPKSLRELERLIKKHIVKKGESKQEEDETVFQVLQKMNKKGMFTQKLRTGESKEHAKDPKLKYVDILEQFRKEKGDIPIVFESQTAYSQK